MPATKHTAIDQHGSGLKAGRKPTTESLAEWLIAAEAAALAGTALKGDEAITFEPGVHVTAPVTLDSPPALVNDGALGRVVLQLDTSVAVTGDALLKCTGNVGVTERKMTATGRIKDLFLEGQFDVNPTDTRIIDGIRLEQAVSEDRVPAIEGTEIKHFSGTGLNVLGNWNQARLFNSKITHCGNGFVAQSMQDAKITSVGIGANKGVQISLTGCATPMFSQVDVWVPGNGAWTGKFGIEIDNCYGVRYIQGDIEAPISLKGINANVSIPGSSEGRHRDMWANFSQVFFKITREVADGYAANHAGDTAYQTTDGLYAPKGFFRIEDFDSLTLDNCQFTFGAEPDFTSEDVPQVYLDARPDYLFSFAASNSASNANLQQDRRGSVFISGSLHVCQFVGKPTAASAGYPVRKPVPLFKRHWSNDPARVHWDGARPQLIKDDLALMNYWVKADGATHNVADAPIAYLATDPVAGTRHLQDGQTTFAMPTMTSPLAGYSWYFRRS